MAIRVGHDIADAEKIARFLSETLRRPVRDGATSAFAAIEIADAAPLGNEFDLVAG
jgi:hypothetical protein